MTPRPIPLRRPAWWCCLVLLAFLSGCATPRPDRVQLQREVTAAEIAFALTMANRDHEAFTRFLADDAVFLSGPVPLRGKAAVAAWWKRFFDQPEAPFSWRPETVEVLDDGTLALSTGPVFGPTGKPVASYTSVWRQVTPGTWRIVFDKGCNCP